jgi:hypothetical protein
MSERSERIIVTGPQAHGCTIPTASATYPHATMVHQ